jgi:NAD(P)-dependent dehydrogenase (short-subunit alcohol dehydrogenase family)
MDGYPGLAGRVALVTGGGRGIGRAISDGLAEHGVRIAISYRADEDMATRAVADWRDRGIDALAVASNAGDPDEVEALVETVQSELGPIELLVNNAGFSRLTRPDDLTFAEWRKLMTVNLDGPFLTTWAVKDAMLAAGRGSIVNIASVAGLVPRAEGIHYGTSKAALIFFTRSCAAAFAPRGVRVNCVAPGLTLTDRTSTVSADLFRELAAAVPLGRAAEAPEVAAVVLFLLSDAASYVTGEVVAASGGRA